MSSKIVSAEQAVDLIRDGDSVIVTSAGIIGYPEYLAKRLETRFIETGAPKNLTLIAAGAHGVGDERCDSRFGRPGMLKRYISTHPVTVPAIGELIAKNEVEGYVVPQGVMNQLLRAMAAGQPGILTKIEMGTCMDPRQDGGKLNTAAKEDLVERMPAQGEEWLFFKSQPVDVAMIRATTADEDGNLTIEQEALRLEILEAALAAKAGKGKVIAQVKQVAERGTLNAKRVAVPGELVDAVVVVDDVALNHRQTNKIVYSPYLSGELRRPDPAGAMPGRTLSPADVICRRAVYELYPGAVVNIGVGIGAGIGSFAEAEGILNSMTFSLEMGSFGGVPTPADDFGAAYDASSYLTPSAMFDFYHGGGLDIAFLGTAEVDKKGNVNVSKFGNKRAGQGGFIDISQPTGKVVFVSYFRAKGFAAEIRAGKLYITKEGEAPRFVDRVEQITFNGEMAAAAGKEVIYITERAVFRLTGGRLMLTEIAPGMDLRKDVLEQMEFAPLISEVMCDKC